ncbi:hypothetical protein EC973_006863 [Apophysomyces ossiformis]|uniref:Uncharacterized protein n=1 Tax=Apophysomyces ossiformis TaxID=679940 RepID=A0A8H7BQ44_9FUNG|nr:hypothetical protein EC973_006863 [Apophysomyces ossiformis]
MERLPAEIIIHILHLVPACWFSSLYQVFPTAIVDEALRQQLRSASAVLQLVSTNMHELMGPQEPSNGRKNESSLPLYFATLDSAYRLIWLLPNFSQSQHYFQVKDAYVSHGKLVLRPGDTRHSQRQHVLTSLYTIRKCLPPLRAGSFSGQSEFSHSATKQDMTIHSAGLLVDACLLSTQQDNTECVDNKRFPPRPMLPSYYSRKIPSPSSSSSFSGPYSPEQPIYPDTTCGYFLVERVGISISVMLDLLQQIPSHVA